MSDSGNGAALPTVSVVLPVRNETEFVGQSLGALLHQDYPDDLVEIIVVDGMSNDDTREKIRELATVSTVKVCVIANPEKTTPNALNRGVRASSGEVVVVMGGHTTASQDFLRRSAETLAVTGADCVGGHLETVGKTGIASAIALAQSSRFGVGGATFRVGAARGRFVDTVAFAAYRRDVFDRIGLFDEELVYDQDDEFNFRLTQAGGRIWFEPSIRCRYYSRSSLGRLWRQYFGYGMYKVRLMQKRGGVPAARQLAPPSLVITLVGGVVAAFVVRRAAFAVVPAAAYGCGVLAASVLCGRRHPRTLGWLPLSYATLHLAYGSGFLRGLWRWRRGWFRPGDAQPNDSYCPGLQPR
jgi:cellulose synthase/poly-beta-1,6-N-acetylglucosamine synthase-like glycosyltransferase